MTARQRWSAFDDAVRLNEDDLLRYFQRRISIPADAAEAFGDLLFTAWKQRRRMPADPQEARMWLYGVARNTMLNTRRSIARRSAAVHRLAEEMRVVDVAPEFDETAVELRVAITALSDEDAELVRLIYWDGLRSHEAATVLNLNASTVRSRLARVKKELRLALSEHHEPAPDERRRDWSSG